jgi:N-succinyldiaminopimelate aminotransferase
VLPGSYLARDTATGNPGRGRVRISLVASLEDCVEAAHRMRRYCRTSRRA